MSIVRLFPEFFLEHPLFRFVFSGFHSIPASLRRSSDDSKPSPEFSNGTLTEVPSIEAFYLDDLEIEMDGVLDDPAWDLAQTGWGFQQMDPERSATSNATARPAAGTGTTISTPASPSAWSQATP